MASRGRFKKTVFDNGLVLTTERHPEYRSLSFGIWIKAGSRNENAPEAGISHFLEHMLFKGTERRTALDIAREVDQVGGEFNAFTGREYTCFHFLLLPKDLGLGVDISNDILLNSKFDPEELERERKVILQEIAMVDESPEELVHDLFFELVYGRHPLGRSILGTANSVRRMRRVDLLRYFRNHYRPSRLIVSVSGDVSHDSVVRRLRPLASSDWPGRTHGVGTKDLGEATPPKVRGGNWWIERATEQVHLVWGVEGPRYTARDRFAALLLNIHLGGGMSSTLFQEIREKNGLAYTVYSMLWPFLDSGLFTVYAATGMSQVPLCLKLMEECIERTQRQLLTEEELRSVKENLKGTILLSADSVEARMTSIAQNELFLHKYVSIDEVCRMIDEVRPTDVRRVARRLFRPEGRSLLCLGPAPSKAVASKIHFRKIHR